MIFVNGKSKIHLLHHRSKQASHYFNDTLKCTKTIKTIKVRLFVIEIEIHKCSEP